MGQAAILTGGLTAVSVAAVLGGLGGTITAGNLVRHACTVYPVLTTLSVLL